MRLAVFGTGYVGLVTGLCLTEVGNHVCFVDIDSTKIQNLQKRILPIYEAQLDDILHHSQDNHLVDFTTHVQTALDNVEAIFIAVGTPQKTDGSADLHAVFQVAHNIGLYLQQDCTVIIKSTVPVGTADMVQNIINTQVSARNLEIKVDVVSNPEFLKEGVAVADFQKPDRIIIGTNSPSAIKKLQAIYAPFNRNHEKIIVMDRRSSELTKYAANTLLATKISLMNELSHIAEAYGADIEMVRKGIGSDPRIGYDFIYPGCGFGGSCFPKDIRALAHSAELKNINSYIIDAVDKVNQNQKNILFSKIQKKYKNLQGKTFAIWGLSFKPNTDDIREAPSLTLIDALLCAGAKIQVYDPKAMHNIKNVYRNKIEYAEDLYSALKNAHSLVIITEWRAFKSPDFKKIENSLIDKTIFDGRNLYAPETVAAYNLEYWSIGRLVSQKDLQGCV